MNYEELMEKYPCQVVCNTGEAHPTYRSIGEFFDDITFLVDSKTGQDLRPNDERVRIHPEFERLVFYLIPPNFATNQKAISNPEQISDQTLHLLRYNNRNLASVIETRTDFNMHNFTFFERIKDAIKEKKEYEI